MSSPKSAVALAPLTAIRLSIPVSPAHSPRPTLSTKSECAVSPASRLGAVNLRSRKAPYGWDRLAFSAAAPVFEAPRTNGWELMEITAADLHNTRAVLVKVPNQ